MPGVIEVDRSVPMGIAIEDLLLLAVLTESGELEGKIIYLPLKQLILPGFVASLFHYDKIPAENLRNIIFGGLK